MAGTLQDGDHAEPPRIPVADRLAVQSHGRFARSLHDSCETSGHIAKFSPGHGPVNDSFTRFVKSEHVEGLAVHAKALAGLLTTSEAGDGAGSGTDR
jgi:hypothetical protein